MSTRRTDYAWYAEDRDAHVEIWTEVAGFREGERVIEIRDEGEPVLVELVQVRGGGQDVTLRLPKGCPLMDRLAKAGVWDGWASTLSGEKK